jgi:hypothetical protein
MFVVVACSYFVSQDRRRCKHFLSCIINLETHRNDIFNVCILKILI